MFVITSFAVMKRGQARSYVRLQFSALRTFYQFLAARKQLRHNPVREVQLPKMEKKLPLVLTRQQVEGTSRSANPRAKEPIGTIMDASARCRVSWNCFIAAGCA